MIRNSAINLILKVGLAFSSLVFAIASFVRASDVLAFYPNFVTSIFGEIGALTIGAVVALIMCGWIVSQKHKFASSFTFLILIGLGILSNITSLTFLAISWPLFCIATALSLRYYPRIRVIVPGKNGGEEKMKIVPVVLEYIERTDHDEDPVAVIEEVKEEAVVETPVAETEVKYGKEVPFSEHVPHSDEDHHYSPLSSLKEMYHIPSEDDVVIAPTMQALVEEKSEYESSQFTDERNTVSAPEIIASALEEIAPVTVDENVYVSPFASPYAEEAPVLKPKRQYKKKVTVTVETVESTPVKAKTTKKAHSKAETSIAQVSTSGHTKLKPAKATAIKAPASRKTTRKPKTHTE